MPDKVKRARTGKEIREENGKMWGPLEIKSVINLLLRKVQRIPSPAFRAEKD